MFKPHGLVWAILALLQSVGSGSSHRHLEVVCTALCLSAASCFVIHVPHCSSLAPPGLGSEPGNCSLGAVRIRQGPSLVQAAVPDHPRDTCGRYPPGGEPYTQEGLPPPLSNLSLLIRLLGRKPLESLGIARDALENSSCVHRCAYSRFALL